jgi:hypothetical protein
MNHTFMMHIYLIECLKLDAKEQLLRNSANYAIAYKYAEYLHFDEFYSMDGKKCVFEM